MKIAALCFKTTFQRIVVKFYFQKTSFGHLFLSFFQNIFGLYIQLRGTKVPPETPSFNNIFCIVFDINH